MPQRASDPVDALNWIAPSPRRWSLRRWSLRRWSSRRSSPVARPSSWPGPRADCRDRGTARWKPCAIHRSPGDSSKTVACTRSTSTSRERAAHGDAALGFRDELAPVPDVRQRFWSILVDSFLGAPAPRTEGGIATAPSCAAFALYGVVFAAIEFVADRYREERTVSLCGARNLPC